MNFRTTLAAAASVALVSAQAALAGGFAPAVDCDVTPDAPECQSVVYAPAATGSSGIRGMGTAGTAAAIAGGVVAAALIAAALDDDDDDDDSDGSSSSSSSEED
ncbi:hypothetical protein [Palleronia caenipelagi]|uniref:Uncharacterized protein n=1 Tax=Palleronia caenipelagi TaxID=2489174 RepID=A0A547Q7L0_9RHOB|nr:hypothetical protein [Palleronia caenipelagi]TRD22366.1 hypothetical protein FEV53_04720 [Palleronia caenipelagi]